ncbi:MAG: O-antigen ligase family protein [Candidatus Omnitrophica bacterium]|nr:O-antigen ligase family protein [Candidatus Omnitrophota bacterium]
MKKQKIEKIADIVMEYSLYGMLFFIPISIAAIEAMAGICFTAFIVKKIVNPDFSFLKNKIYLILLAFFIFNALSLFNSGPYLAKSLKALFFKWFEFLLIFMLAAEGLNNRIRLRNFIIVAVFSAGLISFDGIFQKISGTDFIRGNLLSATGFITASFKNQNSFSAYLIIATLLAISLFMVSHLKIAHKTALFILALLCGTCLLLTQSRGAMLGFFAGLILFSLLSGNYRIILVCLLVFSVALLVLPAYQKKVINTIFYHDSGDRLALIQTTWSMIKDRPFLGMGLGTYMDHFNKYSSMKDVTYYAHNSIMQMWAEAGIFTLLSFLTFLGLLFTKAIKAFKRNKDLAMLGILCGLSAFIIHGFFDNHLYALQLRALFWLMSGALMAMIRAPFIKIEGKE